jgi:hypothetical protein
LIITPVLSVVETPGAWPSKKQAVGFGQEAGMSKVESPAWRIVI